MLRMEMDRLNLIQQVINRQIKRQNISSALHWTFASYVMCAWLFSEISSTFVIAISALEEFTLKFSYKIKLYKFLFNNNIYFHLRIF